MRSNRKSNRAAVVAALAVVGLAPGVSFGSRALSQGKPISSLSATLLAKPFASLNSTQRNIVICDPENPTSGSISIVYDQGVDDQGGPTMSRFPSIVTPTLVRTPRVTLQDVRPAPGYTIDGVVLVEGDSGPFPQPLSSFLKSPAGTESGYAQITFTLVDQGQVGQVPEPGDYTFIEHDGPQAIDTHFFTFDYRPNVPDSTPVEYTVFGKEDGQFDTPRDTISFVDDKSGMMMTAQPEDITPATVRVPEPSAALALVALAGLAAGRRRSRR
jgi:hypothetical protein